VKNNNDITIALQLRIPSIYLCREGITPAELIDRCIDQSVSRDSLKVPK